MASTLTSDVDRPAPPDRRRPGRLVERVALAAVVLFALVGIGTPLLGLTTFAQTDLLVSKNPYTSAGLATGHVENRIANDIVASGLPNTALFAEELKQGRLTAWNPYVGGGGALGAVPNWAVLSPLTLPWYVLPAELAPAYVKLLEMLVAAGGTVLFLRRLGLSRAAGLLGGLAFAASGFMISWTNWPQTRVAAFIPLVFWAADRLATERRVRDGALLAAALAAMLFGGFPALTGYTVLTAGGYLLVRARALAPVLAGVGALVGAVAITAIQLVPFASAMSHAKLSNRAQTGADHLDPAALVTSWAPWSLGHANEWALSGRDNVVEAFAYVGAAALVLFLLAVALPGTARAFLPRGVWSYLVAATAAWAVLLYAGGPPLTVLQKLPVLFADNFVGRARGVLGFLVAALVAVGFEAALRGWTGRTRRWVLGAGAIAVGLSMVAGWRVVTDPRRFAVQCLVGLAVAGLAALAVRLARRRPVVAAALPVLVMFQALVTVYGYWPRVDRDSWYPQTDVHRYLAANLGHERFAASDNGMYAGADSAAKLRSLTGETFFEQRFAQTVQGLPGELFGSTLLRLPPTPELVRSPVLDRLAVRYFVTAPWDKPFGTEAVAAGDGSTVTLRPGGSWTVPLRVRGPIRGVGVTPPTGIRAATRIAVSIRDPRGTELAGGSRVGPKGRKGTPAYVVVNGEHIPAGTRLTAVIRVDGAPLVAAGDRGRPAVSTVAAAADGLSVAYAGSSVVWDRATALPRFRWASAVRGDPDPESRVSVLAAGGLRADEMVLDRAPPVPPAGEPATITVFEDGTDDLAARVDARGAGYLVVADALQHGWGVTVDGAPAALLPADNGLVAVAVPAGTHTVRLAYRMPMHNAGTWISGVALVALLGAVFVKRRRPVA
ncbi:YfhO family protein [Asanoa sp. NPDC050611]|uniref:YfhO family protein n=1 Tax=Asanoa sp. NPDC050611 TaxID=3157098 RepID=UPI0033E381BF